MRILFYLYLVAVALSAVLTLLDSPMGEGLLPYFLRNAVGSGRLALVAHCRKFRAGPNV
jgi:hypothetical protein